MIQIEAEATVIYTCTLTGEDEEKVRKFAKEKGIDIEKATRILWSDAKIDIYAGNTIESDCSTGNINLLEDYEEE